MASHADCTHASTKAARADCRRQGGVDSKAQRLTPGQKASEREAADDFVADRAAVLRRQRERREAQSAGPDNLIREHQNHCEGCEEVKPLNSSGYCDDCVASATEAGERHRVEFVPQQYMTALQVRVVRELHPARREEMLEQATPDPDFPDDPDRRVVSLAGERWTALVFRTVHEWMLDQDGRPATAAKVRR